MPETFTFLGLWAIEDPELTVPQAIEEAKATLPDLLVEQHVVLLGDGKWDVAESRTFGLPESDGVVLVLTAPAAPWSALPHTPSYQRGRHAA